MNNYALEESVDKRDGARLICLAGEPATTTPSGTDFSTTEFAATIEPRPISILPKTVAAVQTRAP